MLASLWTLAHQGGWDELLMFGSPILLAILAVRFAERRAKARSESSEAADDEREDVEH